MNYDLRLPKNVRPCGRNLKKISGKEIILIQKTDPALLAGVRVELDGKLLDGTVKNRISEISDKIHHATV